MKIEIGDRLYYITKQTLETLNNAKKENKQNLVISLDLGLSIVKSAIDRKESRGAHFRIDYPEKYNLNNYKRTEFEK